jgi:predicted alpha/beta superfamily hydrolase
MSSLVISLLHRSRVLKNNPLKDPHERELLIYFPPSYKRSTKRYPVVYLISGFTGYGKMNMNLSPY